MCDKNYKIYQRKDQRYEIRYSYGVKSNGKTNYNSVYGKTKSEVIRKYNIIINKKIKENDLKILDKSLFGSDIYKWLNSAKIRCKKSTFSNYQYTVNARIIPKFANLKKKSITSEIIDNYTYELLEEGLVPKTVKDILIILQQILKYAELNVRISMPKVPKKEIQIFTKEEQKRLEEFLLFKLNNVQLGIFICLYTGLRIGEICALKWEDIDIENKKFKIKKTITRIKNPIVSSSQKTIIVIDEPKSLSSIRDIPIPDFLIPMLIKFSCFSKSSDFFITGTNKFIETRTFFNKYKKILKQLHMEKYNFHALRHTFATRCIENGCDPKTLSEILGHSNVNITLERYVHPNYENKVRMMNKLKPMYN